MPRRIVIDGRRLAANRTGVGRYLESLLRQWAATGLPAESTHVVLSYPSGLNLVPKAIGLTAQVAVAGFPGLLWERFGLARALRPGDLLFAPANLVPRAWRGRTVLVMHDALQSVRPRDFSRSIHLRFDRRYRRAVEAADRVLVPSESTARDLQNVYGLSRDRMAVIPPAPDPEFRPLPPDDPIVLEARRSVGLGDSPFFLFAGKRSRRRNVPAILDAFAKVRARLADHKLVFVGGSAGRGIEGAAPPPGVLDAGHVAEPILRGLMASAVALLYPSEHEGFGLPVVEAMASGCPVVTLRRDALIEAGGNGPIYLETADPGLLADAMTALATDGDHRGQRVETGLAEASKYSMRDFADAVKGELQRVARD